VTGAGQAGPGLVLLLGHRHHDGRGDAGDPGQQLGPQHQFQRVEQRVVAPLPGGAGVFDPVNGWSGGGEGVEVGEQQFGQFRGGLERAVT
jgi:hypothetical protein